MEYKKYLYKAYLLQCLFTDIEELGDQNVLTAQSFERMLVDTKALPWYNLTKRWRGEQSNESN